MLKKIIKKKSMQFKIGAVGSFAKCTALQIMVVGHALDLKIFIPATAACTLHDYRFIAPIMSLPMQGR